MVAETLVVNGSILCALIASEPTWILLKFFAILSHIFGTADRTLFASRKQKRMFNIFVTGFALDNILYLSFTIKQLCIAYGKIGQVLWDRKAGILSYFAISCLMDLVSCCPFSSFRPH